MVRLRREKKSLVSNTHFLQATKRATQTARTAANVRPARTAEAAPKSVVEEVEEEEEEEPPPLEEDSEKKPNVACKKECKELEVRSASMFQKVRGFPSSFLLLYHFPTNI